MMKPLPPKLGFCEDGIDKVTTKMVDDAKARISKVANSKRAEFGEPREAKTGALPNDRAQAMALKPGQPTVVQIGFVGDPVVAALLSWHIGTKMKAMFVNGKE